MTMKYLAAAAVVALSLASATGAGAAELWNATVPANGQGEVASPNSLPPGFTDGTAAAVDAKVVAQWFGQQHTPAFASAPTAQQPNG